MVIERTLVNDIIVVHLTPFQKYVLFVKNVASEHVKECLVKVRLATSILMAHAFCVCVKGSDRRF